MQSNIVGFVVFLHWIVDSPLAYIPRFPKMSCQHMWRAAVSIRIVKQAKPKLAPSHLSKAVFPILVGLETPHCRRLSTVLCSVACLGMLRWWSSATRRPMLRGIAGFGRIVAQMIIDVAQ
jgi:hypothetical protein